MHYIVFSIVKLINIIIAILSNGVSELALTRQLQLQ